MNFQEKINSDFLEFYKAKNELATSVLRILKSAIKNKEISKGKELNDTDFIEVISREIKQRKDSIVQYKEGNRPELAEKEEKELKILLNYLPKQMTKEEISKIVTGAISDIHASGVKDMGKVMGTIMPKVKGKADGTLVSEIVKSELSK